ncbi:MAG TPA: hypothetical protein VIX84_21735 [Acidimicrobiales bacterium]
MVVTQEDMARLGAKLDSPAVTIPAGPPPPSAFLGVGTDSISARAASTGLPTGRWSYKPIAMAGVIDISAIT